MLFLEALAFSYARRCMGRKRELLTSFQNHGTSAAGQWNLERSCSARMCWEGSGLVN